MIIILLKHMCDLVFGSDLVYGFGFLDFWLFVGKRWVWNLVFVDKPFGFELLVWSSTCSKFWRGFRIDSIIVPLLISKSQVMTKFHKWLFQQRKLLARYFGIYLIFLQLLADHKKQGNCNKNFEYLYIFLEKNIPWNHLKYLYIPQAQSMYRQH